VRAAALAGTADPTPRLLEAVALRDKGSISEADFAEVKGRWLAELAA